MNGKAVMSRNGGAGVLVDSATRTTSSRAPCGFRAFEGTQTSGNDAVPKCH